MSHQIKKDVNYLNKDFGDFRKNLIDFTRNYFPNTYNDFNESSPGMMFMEMSAYVGDVLSYYTDASLKESMLNQAEERPNILAISQAMGYKPKNTVGAPVTLDIFQLIPSVGSGTNTTPDWNYAMLINENIVVKSETSDAQFRTLEPVDFAYSSSLSPTEVTVYTINDTTSEPDWYLLKKSVPAISGKILSTTATFGSPKIYDKVVLDDTNIIEIVDITDSNGNKWLEVPFLAQDTVFESVRNISTIDPTLAPYSSTAPYLLKLKKTSRRFTTRMRADNRLEIQFGAGISTDTDEELIPNPDLVGSVLPGRDKEIDLTIDPSNFLYTKTYGLAPANTTLTIRYTTGLGVADNVPANVLTDITDVVTTLDETGLSAALVSQVKRSIAVVNPAAAVGGKSKESLTEIRNNAMANFAAQNRAVTPDDYIIRAYSLPSKFGAIAKAHIVQDDQLRNLSSDERVPNPLALNLYVLGYDLNKNLVALNAAIKQNLKTYLSQYRMVTDAINIKEAFIINIGIDFEIVVLPEYNSNEVLLRCVDKLRSIFSIDKWQINQPIMLNKLSVELDKIEGVQTVISVDVINKYDRAAGYSGNIYNIKEATKEGIIYPSLDPSIFEVKSPSSDIRGRVVAV